MTSLAPTRVTPEQFAAMADADRYELVCGELVERHGGSRASQVGAQFIVHVGGAIRHGDLPYIYSGADGGFQCFAEVLPEDPGRVLIPDCAVISRSRLPVFPDTGWVTLAPDLVLEVVSPNDIAEQVEAKAWLWLRAGVRLVWVAYPASRTVHVYRRGGEYTVGPGDTLDGGDVLPGFSVPVDELFRV
jgi:Uma2 family endonuclease